MDRTLSYVVRRLLVLVVGILVILTAEFVILRVMPEDPMMLAMPRNPSTPAESIEEIRAIFGEPLYVQYFQFIGDMLTGEFYTSYWYEDDVSTIILDSVGRTLLLFISTLCVCLLLGVLFAYLTSRLRGHVGRQLLSFVPLAMLALPVVGWAWMMGFVFSVQFDLLPVGGHMTPGLDPDDPSRLMDFIEHSILPLASVILASLGMFALALRDGQDRAAATSSPERPSLRDGLFVAMPSVQFLVATAMCFVIVIEVFFSYRGLGWTLIWGFDRFDYFVIQAAVFVIAIIVLLTNFAIETAVTLARPKRRLDLYLGEDRGPPPPVPAQAAQQGSLAGATKGVVTDYLRSPVGIISLVVLLGMVALAVVGPMLSSDDISYEAFYSSSNMFLDGATAMVAVPLLAAVFASVIGIALGVLMGLIRPYADGFVAGVMQGLMAITVVCLMSLVSIVSRAESSAGDLGYLTASLDFMLPVAALVTLFVCHGFVSARKRLAAAGGGSVLGAPSVRYGPSMASWTLGALKYGVPMTALAVFVCDFLNITHLESWGRSLEFAYNQNMLLTGEWDYVLLPLIGTVLLVGSMFLVLDTLERVVRTRFAHLV